MLRVLHLINRYNHKVNTYVFDPYNNELIDPKTGESNFLSKPSYESVFEMKPTSNYKFIKRTF